MTTMKSADWLPREQGISQMKKKKVIFSDYVHYLATHLRVNPIYNAQIGFYNTGICMIPFKIWLSVLNYIYLNLKANISIALFISCSHTVKAMLHTVYNLKSHFLEVPISNFRGVKDILFPFMNVPVLNAIFSIKCSESKW